MTKPIVGLSANVLHHDPDRRLYDGRPLLYLEQSMATWLMRAGARPYLIPFVPNEGSCGDPALEDGTPLDEMVEPLDGLILQGGADVAPETYGEDPIDEKWSGDPVRDAYEIELLDACLYRDIPVLGICRGLQLINVALGGSLYQDIATQHSDDLDHRDRDVYEQNFHHVTFEPDSHLAQIYPDTQGGLVSSVHHQAIKKLADDLLQEAHSTDDGIIEAARLDHPHHYALGVQWHPEFQDPSDTKLLDTRPLLQDFLTHCS